MTEPTPDPGMPVPPMPRPKPAVITGEYRITATRNGRPVAHAIRTLWSWHVPLGRRADGMRQWASYNDRDRAAQALAAIAGSAVTR